ncbi:MAG: T9SS type A sorting domain-containing protein [Bacteroidetes bacterium]|nr:T9SS type A sorting domain-containing protein [Bacteroidota bacterium]
MKTQWNQNTTETKLTQISPNLYSLAINLSINDYFGVAAEDEILKIAIVFRNSDGTLVGREANGSDIFISVYSPGINLNISSPESNLIFESNETITISANSTNADSLKIWVNNILLIKVESSTVTYDHTETQTGRHKIKIEAKSSSDSKTDSVFFNIRGTTNDAALPSGWKQGVNYISHDSVGLVLLAPDKDFVYVIGGFNNWENNENYMMNRTYDGEMFWLGVGGLQSGEEYIFQYFIDGEIRIADPFADKLSDPSNDQWISDETYPGLIGYPIGKTTQIASVLQTSQSEYQWQNTNFSAPQKEDLVIYELLVRDFVATHDFNTLIDTIDYLDNLGVNAIELMPINEFEGNESWGYNTSFYFAPDKYYGTKNKLKEFIDTCHNHGIAVIIDMVLNHSYGQSPLVQMYFDPTAGSWGQPTAENPWYNETSPNNVYSWGFDFNHESQYTKNFIDSVNSYWLTEYKVDGFRFDFTKGFTNTPGDGGAYDASRIAILKRMADKIWTVKNNAYVILEHFAPNNEENELSSYGMMIWGNINHEYSEAAMGYSSNLSWASYKNRGWSQPNLISYMESHDEERLMYKNLLYGNSSGNYDIKELQTALRRIELNANFFFPIPGPKLIWQFEEVGYDISIDYDCRVCNKPIRWDYFNTANRKRIYQVYKELIQLKKQYDVFRTDDFDISLSSTMKSIHLYNQDINVVVLGNFGVVQNTMDPVFPSIGIWYEYFSGNTLNVSDVNDQILLDPGEYRLYSSVKFGESLFTAIGDIPSQNILELIAFPNPATTTIKIKLSSIHEKPGKLLIYNSIGQIINSLDLTGVKKSSWFSIDVSNFNNGVYYLKAICNKNIYSGKFIKR